MELKSIREIMSNATRINTLDGKVTFVREKDIEELVLEAKNNKRLFIVVTRFYDNDNWDDKIKIMIDKIVSYE